MINPAATAFDADQQATPLPPSSSTSPGFVGNGSTHGDRSHPTEDENRDSHRDEEKIDGLTTKYSERPSGTVAQRQMRRFAKSADKRQSVHMLGSIEHLKHHFLKFGLAAQETPDISGAPQPALGLSLRVDNTPNHQAQAGGANQMPSPNLPATVQRSPYPIIEDTKVDLNSLRVAALTSLQAVDKIWRINPPPGSGTDATDEPSEIDILEVLRVSVEAIRAVRAYSLALPASSLVSSSKTPSTSMLRVPSGLGRARQPLSTPSRPAPRSVSSSGSGSSILRNPSPVPEDDPLAEVRKAALDLLIGLRAVEERSRVEESGQQNAGSERMHVEATNSTETQDASPLHDRSSIQNAPQREIATSPRLEANLTIEEQEDEDDDLSFFFPNESEEQDSRDSWYKRLNDADREGWLYRTDLRVDDNLIEEQQLVKAWLEAVDRRIFGGQGNLNQYAWTTDIPGQVDESNGRRFPMGALAGVDVNWLDPEQTPDALERCRGFLDNFLPLDLSSRISPVQNTDVNGELLNILADGYLCIIAFNACLQHSASPWGQISMEDVHDTFGMTAPSVVAIHTRRDWTFRRAENLKLFGAALKHRYRVPLHFPYQIIPLKPAGIPLPQDNRSSSNRTPLITSSSTVSHNSRIGPDGIYFDPVAIARRDVGWEETLQRVIDAWLRSVYEELYKQQH